MNDWRQNKLINIIVMCFIDVDIFVFEGAIGRGRITRVYILIGILMWSNTRYREHWTLDSRVVWLVFVGFLVPFCYKMSLYLASRQLHSNYWQVVCIRFGPNRVNLCRKRNTKYNGLTVASWLRARCETCFRPLCTAFLRTSLARGNPAIQH